MNSPNPKVETKFGRTLAVETRRKVSRDEMREYVKETVKTVVERSYRNGSSNDVRRPSTPQEAEILEKIIYGALESLLFGGEVQTVCDTAEFIGMMFLPCSAGPECNKTHLNSCDTIYWPIKKWWDAQTKED